VAAGKLKNIRFSFLDVTILSIEKVPRVLIKWDLEPTAQNLKDMRFFVDRGESPSDMQQLNAEPILANGVREFVDYTAKLIDLHKIYYYRVRAVEFFNSTAVQTFQTEVQPINGNLDLVGLYIVEDRLFEHRYVDGVPVMIFKKKREGSTCPECWDPVLKRVTKSNCLTCRGTGKLGGFYPPIDGWMKFDLEPKMAQVVEWGVRQANQTDIEFTNYPLLNLDDIILECKPHKFWKVTLVRPFDKNRATMLQLARVDAVYPKDIEQTLEVPEARRLALVAQLNERDKEREF
jgi:hypothetical protein